jgi:hypothetical protein
MKKRSFIMPSTRMLLKTSIIDFFQVRSDRKLNADDESLLAELIAGFVPVTRDHPYLFECIRAAATHRRKKPHWARNATELLLTMLVDWFFRFTVEGPPVGDFDAEILSITPIIGMNFCTFINAIHLRLMSDNCSFTEQTIWTTDNAYRRIVEEVGMLVPGLERDLLPKPTELSGFRLRYRAINPLPDSVSSLPGLVVTASQKIHNDQLCKERLPSICWRLWRSLSPEEMEALREDLVDHKNSFMIGILDSILVA